MKLKELLEGVRAVRIEGDTERDITGVNMDSRLVEQGDLFVAVKGTQADLISARRWRKVRWPWCVRHGLKHCPRG